MAAAALPGCGPEAGGGRGGPLVTKGRIHQSVCQWCFKGIELEALARRVAAMGAKSIELVPPKDWPILKRHGLTCALSTSHGFVDGFCRTENHAMCVEKVAKSIDATAEAGFPNVIAFAGFNKGLSRDVALANTVAGLKKVIGRAEQKKVTICLEVLNSRVDVEMKGHPGYVADTVEWVAQVCDKVGSQQLKILFDIYHVQIMQGDIITRIRRYKDYIGHYHVAGVPGRNEPDETQELNYPAILRAVAHTGYSGYVAQEFLPTRDPLSSLAKAVKLCDV